MNQKANSLANYGKEISKIQFNSYCYCRQPQLQFFSKEIEWYSLFDNRLLAVVIFDFTDNDYGYVILGRDENRLFRCIDGSKEFFSTVDLARQKLAQCIQNQYEFKIQDCYPQNDINKKRINLFKEIILPNKQHKNYRVLAKGKQFEAARNLISEIANSFIDNDGHFAREFQSVNFHARLWELYLHMYFNHNMNFHVTNQHASPDFELSCFGEKIFVEAATVNPSTDKKRPDAAYSFSPTSIQRKLRNFMPIKFGSVLLSKLNKKYWEKSHVKGHPLIIAIHDYHNDDSMTWSRTALANYLYGFEAKVKQGCPILKKISKHKWQGKEIKSGFFFQPESKYISGVLFSNQATLTKFNRMGRLGGLGGKQIKIVRISFLFDPDPNAFEPLIQFKDIDESDYEESWSEGLVMYHNPNAVFPLNPPCFDDISHVFYDKYDGLVGFSKPYDVLNSITLCFTDKLM